MNQAPELRWGPLWVLLGALLAGSCGYRPAARVVAEDGVTAFIPSFTSYAPYPELDVFAGSLLSARLRALGVTSVANRAGADVGVQGVLIQTVEQPLAVGAAHTLIRLRVDVRVEVDGGERTCTTPVAYGASEMRVPLDRVSEGERFTALEAATADAVEQLVLESLGCIRRVRQ